MPRSFQTSIMMPAVKCVHLSELTLVWDMLLGYFTDLVNLQTRVRAHLLPLVDHWLLTVVKSAWCFYQGWD